MWHMMNKNYFLTYKTEEFRAKVIKEMEVVSVKVAVMGCNWNTKSIKRWLTEKWLIFSKNHYSVDQNHVNDWKFASLRA